MLKILYNNQTVWLTKEGINLPQKRFILLAPDLLDWKCLWSTNALAYSGKDVKSFTTLDTGATANLQTRITRTLEPGFKGKTRHRNR